MTESSGPFTVGTRIYWIHEAKYPAFMAITLFDYIYNGVVMSTGPAVTQVWNDNDSNPRDHHALTFANDKIWADRETPAQIIRDKRREEKELRREAEAWMAKDDAERAAEKVPFAPGGIVPTLKRRRWFTWM
jgi:hypothetical protein